MTGLLSALAFLTRVRVGNRATHVDPAKSAPFVPVVGALIGLVVACVYIGVNVDLPRLSAAVLATGVGVLLTGALHEDGLADTADALGSRDQAGVLRILRDPTHGTYGVLALVLSVMLRVVALTSLNRAAALTALPLAHMLSRTIAISLIAAGPALAEDGLGAAYGPAIRGRPLALALSSAAIVTAVLLGAWAPAAIGATIVTGFTVRHMAIRRFRGLNGDIAGAGQQLAEVALLLLASAHPVAMRFIG